MSLWSIQPLANEHDRSHFDCGEESLNDFLKKFARQNEDKGVSRTFVLVKESESRVFGFYTLSAGEVSRDKLPAKEAKKLPKYPVPVVVLGRLAVDRTAQGEKLGRYLLKDALHRALSVSAQIGCYAVCVRALHDKAAKFYAKFGFSPLPEDPFALYLAVANLHAAASEQ